MEKCVQGLGGRGVCEDQKDKSVPPKSNFLANIRDQVKIVAEQIVFLVREGRHLAGGRGSHILCVVRSVEGK